MPSIQLRRTFNYIFAEQCVRFLELLSVEIDLQYAS